MPVENHKLQAVLWDLDGVLVDTGEFHFISWQETLPQYQLPFSRELFERTFGMNNQGVISLLLGYPAPAEMVNEIGDRKEMVFREAVRGRARPLPGVLNLLDRFRRSGIPQAVASSAPQENVDVLVDELGIRPFFKAIVSGADRPGKPDPATFLRAAALIGAPPPACLVFEDAVVGVEAAHRAGMKCVAITTTHPREKLRAADLLIDRFDQFPSDIDQLFQEPI